MTSGVAKSGANADRPISSNNMPSSTANKRIVRPTSAVAPKNAVG